MAYKIGNIVIDCADPDRLSGFWAEVLGYEKGEFSPELRAELLATGLTDEDLADRGLAEDPSGEGPRLFFQRVPEPKTAKNRWHVDVNATPGRRAEPAEVDAEVERIKGLGATVLEKMDRMWGGWPEYHYVMADPEGNEFCVQ